MIETTISQLRQLKLNGMASALQTRLDHLARMNAWPLPNACNY